MNMKWRGKEKGKKVNGRLQCECEMEEECVSLNMTNILPFFMFKPGPLRSCLVVD